MPSCKCANLLFPKSVGTPTTCDYVEFANKEILNVEVELGSSSHPKSRSQCAMCDVQPALIGPQCKLVSDYGKSSLLPLCFLTPNSNSLTCPSRNVSQWC